MRKIMIVGAGQSGLQLALGLQARGYDVTVTSNREPDAIRTGKVMSSQCMFHDNLQLERDRGINFWEAECPPVEGISFTVPHPEIAGEKALACSARLDWYAQSVDQRVKVPLWMQTFTERGGNIVYKEADTGDLERWSQSYDLVVVAAGKGAIAQMFERDASRSPYDKPQRALALTYVTGMTPRSDHSAVCFNMIPGVGEYFVFPALTTTGPCEIMVFEGVPGGPMDCWADVKTPAEHLARSREILQKLLPWESSCCDKVETAIVAHGAQAFDADFMQRCFEGFWNSYGQHATNWTNALLMPPPPHVLKVLGTAMAVPQVAHRIVNGFNDPTDYVNFFMTPDKVDAYLGELAPA